MRSSNARAAGWTAMILAALLISPPGPAHAGEGIQIIASLIKAIQSPGRIDYAERINAPLREGVTPENNFFAAIFPLTPLDSLDESDGEWVQALCDEIGCVHPAEEPIKYVAPKDVEYARDLAENEAWDEIRPATYKLWNPGYFPLAQSWVSANEACWQRVVKAASRSHAYRPQIPPKDNPLELSAMPDLQVLLELSVLGAARVHRSISRNDLELARTELLTVHRIVHHVGQASSAIQLGAAYSIHDTIRVAEAHYLSHPDTTAKQRMAYLSEIDRLPPIRSASEVFDSVERWSTIDSLDFYRRGILNPVGTDEFNTDRMGCWQHAFYQLIFAAIVDWSDINIGAHAIYDSIGDALEMPAGLDRKKAIEELIPVLCHYVYLLPEETVAANNLNEWMTTVGQFAEMQREQRGFRLGKAFAVRHLRSFQSLESLEQMYQCRVAMLPALIAVMSDFDRTGNLRLDTIGLRLPDGRSLDVDSFNGEPYRINYGWNSITIYSVGPDGVDHGGQSGELYDGTIADDEYLRFEYENTPEKVFQWELANARTPFWEAEIPREWKGVGIILASLSFGAISLWLRRRKA